MRRPLIITGAILVLAVIAGILFAVVVMREPETAAADPTPTPSPTPTSPAVIPSAEPIEQPAPSEVPSAPVEPTEEPAYRDPIVADPSGVLPPGGIVRVIADGLRLREQPMLASQEVTTVGRGEFLVVGPTSGFAVWGPYEADGYTWYPAAVMGTDELPTAGGAPFRFDTVGWMAIGDDESPWVELQAPRCTDDEPTLQLIGSLTEWERLACYGNEQITFEGVFGCGGCGGMIGGQFTPEWLASPMNFDLFSVEPQDFIGPLDLHWSPDGPARPEDQPGVAPILRVTGHFDDPASAECSHTWLVSTFGEQGDETSDPLVSQLYCRSNFVVDSFEVIGEDEDFPFS